MSESKRTRNIAFRVNDEDYAKIERAAAAAGDEPNSWCRKAALSKLNEGHNRRTADLSGGGFVTVPLKARIQDAFKINENTAATWKKLTTQADHKRSLMSYFLGDDDSIIVSLLVDVP